MKVDIAYGLHRLEVEVREENILAVHREEPAQALHDPAQAVNQALEHPLGFPPLRQALTPDDHIAVVVDERLPELVQLLLPIFQHLLSAHIAPHAITLVCPPGSGKQEWLEELPEEYQEVRLEVHNPGERKKLSYLAATKQGRRIYLNRTVVDADQIVVLTRRDYDPLLGYGGAEGAIFPILSDEATRKDASARLTLDAPGAAVWPWQKEAAEVAWLLGAPFLVQVVEGTDKEILHVLAGPMEASPEGQKLLDARWWARVDKPADVVIAGMGGDPSRHTFGDLARALACAARVVKPEGRIVLLSDAQPSLGPSAQWLRQAESPGEALHLLHQHQPPDLEAGFFWARAAQKAHLYLLSKIPQDVAEELFLTPLEQAGQAQRLITDNASCLFLPDAHKTMAVVRGSPREARG